MIQFTNSFVNKTCDILDKKESIGNYVSYMLDRTSQMFEYDGLPDTIPGYILETYLQVFGGVAICKMKGELWAIFGNPGGALDPYYRPTIFVAANPALGESRTFRIENHLKPFDASAWSSYEPCIYLHQIVLHILLHFLSFCHPPFSKQFPALFFTRPISPLIPEPQKQTFPSKQRQPEGHLPSGLSFPSLQNSCQK